MTTVDRSAWRWRAYPRAILLAMLAAVIVVVATAEDGPTLPGELGGDLPTFYAAGSIIRSGDGDRLYDVDRQAEEQAPYWEDEGTMILFVYPPAFAAPYAPLSALDYRVVYLAHSAVMLGALVVSLRLVVPLLAPHLDLLADPDRRLAVLAFSLAFLPMFTGTLLGQNTALIVLALSAVWWGVVHRSHTVVGVAAGLLMLKPQYGLPVIGLVLLTRRWSALGVGAGVVAGLYAVSAVISGADWPRRWAELVTSLSEVDLGSNLSNEVSILGLAEVVLGAGSPVARAIWVGIGSALVVAVLLRLRARSALDPVVLALVPPMLLLIAPHALYYDAGILLLSVGALLVTLPHRWVRPVLAGWLVLGLGSMVSDRLGVQPVALLVVATFVWAWWASAPGRAAGGAERPRVMSQP